MIAFAKLSAFRLNAMTLNILSLAITVYFMFWRKHVLSLLLGEASGFPCTDQSSIYELTMRYSSTV